MTGEYEPAQQTWEWGQAKELRPSLDWPVRRLETTTVAVAALLTLVISVTAALLTYSNHGFLFAVAIAISAVAVASGTISGVARLRSDRRPSWAEELAAMLRIRVLIDSLLVRYGIEDPEIHPPVKLVDVPETRAEQDLRLLLSTTQSTSSEYFLSRFAEIPRLTLILGNYGSGKTSLLLRLTRRMLDERPYQGIKLIPVFFKCAEWSEEYGSLHKWIVASAYRAYQVPAHVSDYWIRTGKLFVALDGLEELPDEKIAGFANAIQTWTQAAEGTRLAISSRSDRPNTRTLLQSLDADQVCAIQPLPDSDLQRYLRRLLAQLSPQTSSPKIHAMDVWMQELVSQNDHLRGPALVGLLGEALDEAKQLPGTGETFKADADAASFAFQVANSFFSRGNFAVASDIYRAITSLSDSRWHIPAYTLLATCLYMLDRVDEASDVMMESVALRLQESIKATPDALRPLSDIELRCLSAIPADISLDLAQIGSAASLPISLSRQAVQNLRERGLIETVEDTDERPRFRRSAVMATSRYA